MNKNPLFASNFESAFSSFLNRSVGEHTIAEVLARSSEKMLKKGNDGMTEKEIYSYIENLTTLFSYMEDKDLFIEVYKCGLAKRLLDDKLSSLDYEKALIGKIKMTCGPQYTSGVEGMLSDLNNESELIKEFTQTDQYSALTCEFSVKVLTDGYWPSFKSPPVILPSHLNG